MSDVRVTAEQADVLRKLVRGEVRFTDPGVREAVGHLTADDLDEWVAREREHADAQLARMEALQQAMRETAGLMREHGMETAGEFAELGIANPAAEVANRLLRAYEDGEMSDDDLRDLGISRDADGALMITVSSS